MIIGLGGNLSGGKTVTAVRFAYEQGLKGKKIISNIKLNFPENIQVEYMSNPEFIEFIKINYENSEALKRKFYNTVFLADEIVHLLSGRRTTSTIAELLTNYFMMCGKLNQDVVMTYQLGTSQLDNRIREAVMNKEGICLRCTNKGIVFDNSERILNEKIYILIIWQTSLGFLGNKRGYEIYDPSIYFPMYDTREIVLMDRTVYLKGGTKDLTKKLNLPKNNSINLKDFQFD